MLHYCGESLGKTFRILRLALKELMMASGKSFNCNLLRWFIVCIFLLSSWMNGAQWLWFEISLHSAQVRYLSKLSVTIETDNVISGAKAKEAVTDSPDMNGFFASL